jgi:hypothetical protein
MVSKILSAVFAIIAAIIILGLLIKLLGFALDLLFGFVFIVIILILALPLYVIIKKKLFKN